jgi:hypothetical protein
MALPTKINPQLPPTNVVLVRRPQPSTKTHNRIVKRLKDFIYKNRINVGLTYRQERQNRSIALLEGKIQTKGVYTTDEIVLDEDVRSYISDAKITEMYGWDFTHEPFNKTIIPPPKSAPEFVPKDIYFDDEWDLNHNPNPLFANAFGYEARLITRPNNAYIDLTSKIRPAATDLTINRLLMKQINIQEPQSSAIYLKYTPPTENDKKIMQYQRNPKSYVANDQDRHLYNLSRRLTHLTKRSSEIYHKRVKQPHLSHHRNRRDIQPLMPVNQNETGTAGFLVEMLNYWWLPTPHDLV